MPSSRASPPPSNAGLFTFHGTPATALESVTINNHP